MFDTMTLTKITGGFCGALLIYLLGGFVGDKLYTTSTGHGGHGDQAYVIDTGGDAGAAEEEVEVDFVALVADADPGKGERVFGKCKACHNVDGTDATGPHLNGVVNREIATVAGFAYSDALTARTGDVWDPDHLNGFLESPKGWAPGTKMGFSGLKKIEDRANVVSYLESLGS